MKRRGSRRLAVLVPVVEQGLRGGGEGEERQQGEAPAEGSKPLARAAADGLGRRHDHRLHTQHAHQDSGEEPRRRSGTKGPDSCHVPAQAGSFRPRSTRRPRGPWRRGSWRALCCRALQSPPCRHSGRRAPACPPSPAASNGRAVRLAAEGQAACAGASHRPEDGAVARGAPPPHPHGHDPRVGHCVIVIPLLLCRGGALDHSPPRDHTEQPAVPAVSLGRSQTGFLSRAQALMLTALRASGA